MKKKLWLTVLTVIGFSPLFAQSYGVPAVNQNSWRWRNNDGSEIAASWKAAQNTGIYYNSINEIVRLRIEIVNTSYFRSCPVVCYNTPSTISMRDSLQFSTTPTDALSWKNIGLNATLPFVMANAGTDIVQNEATTSQLTGSSYTFYPGKAMVSDSVINNISIPGNGRSEYEWTIIGTRNLVPNTTYYFRQRGKYGIYIAPSDYTQYSTAYPSLSTGTPAINKAPAISIVNPAHDTTCTAPATFTVRAEASDPDGSISSVKFYNGATYLSTDFTKPYGYTFSNLPAGTYSITAKATDNLNAQTMSAPVKVIVNKAPVVSITSPDSSAVYYAPATINISATATDADGAIAKVEFYNGITLLKSDITSPYSFSWTNVAAGTYYLKAKATDNFGLSTTSSIIRISVLPNKAPVVSITNPLNNAVYTAGATINVSASASDGDGTIKSVKFYRGTTLVKTESISPYTYSWTNASAGTYSLTAKATDNHGLSTTSAIVHVSVVAKTTIVSSKPGSLNNQTDANGSVSLKLSPNPASNILRVSTNGMQQNKPATVSVISSSGVVMKTIQSNASGKVVQLDVSSMVSGVYIIKVVSGDKVIHKQFVKL